MKRVNRLLTFLLLALISTTLAWGGNIATTSSTGGTLAYYSDEACTSGLDVDNVAAGGTVYVKATPDATHTFGTAAADGKVTFITAQVTTSVFLSRSASGTVPLGSFLDVWRVSDGIYRLTMPDDANLNVRVSAVFPVKTEELTTYLDANGDQQEVMASILAGTETEIGTEGTTTWYVAKTTTAAFTSRLWLHGDVNIILADGATMTIGTTESPISNNYALYNNDGSTGIYAQSIGSSRGKLSVAAVNNAGIYSRNNITIVGAEVEATTSGSSYGHSGIRTNEGGAVSLINAVVTAKGYYGIYAFGGMTISGSHVTATGDNEAGIYSYGSIIINGSQVNATGPEYGIRTTTSATVTGSQVTATGKVGFRSDGTITLGWTALTDFIHASSYEGTVTIASGQHFVAYDGQETATALVSGTIKTQNLSTIAGKTLRPMEGYLVTAPDGVAVAATREVEGATVSVDPTIIGATPYYIYKEGDQVTLTVTVPDGEVIADISYSDGTTTTSLTATDNVCSFAMPAKDITVSFSTGPAPIPYLDENGEEQHCTSYIILTGTITNTSLADGWYVAEGNVTFNSTVYVNGDAHLILKDGAVVNVGTEESPISYYGIYASGHSLSIYGQSKGENKGQLNVYSDYMGFSVYNASVTINGGQVTANGKGTTNTGRGIDLNGDCSVTINGGEVTATGTSFGIFTSSSTGSVTIKGGKVTANGSRGIYAKNGTVTISGGQVTASGNQYGIYADNSIVTLGWTNLTDFIHASRYSISGTGSISIAEGKTFIDDDSNPYESGPLSSEQLAALVDKTLRPISEDAVAYLDMNGQRRYCQTYTVLTGSETTLGTAGQETWYVVQGTVNYTTTLKLLGNTHIILADNAVMNVTVSGSFTSGITSTSGNNSLFVYGQSGQSGEMNVTSADYYALFVSGGDITIAGGKVSVEGESGIVAEKRNGNGGNVIIKNATVTASTNYEAICSYTGDIAIDNSNVTATVTGFYSTAINASTSGNILIKGGKTKANGELTGIMCDAGDITIEGGQVEASGINGIVANDITLGWNNATDYILAKYFVADGDIVSIDEGKAFVTDETTPVVVSGTVSTSTIGRKKLLPAVAVTLEEGITAVSGIIASGNGSTGSPQAYYAKVGETVTVNTNGAAIPAGYTITVTPEVSVTDNGNGTYSFTVPAEDVSVSGTTFASTGQAVTVSYIDADGNPQEHLAIALDGSETTLGSEGEETWYFVGADINYTDKITLADGGAVHIILVDGKTMNVTHAVDLAESAVDFYSDSDSDPYSIKGASNLTIYGQLQGTGTLSAADMIKANNITINGGTVKAITRGDDNNYQRAIAILSIPAIWAMGEFVVNGGMVYAKGTPGIGAMGNITLGWTNNTDYINANGYFTRGTLSIAGGKAFIDEDGNTYSGTISPTSIDEEHQTYPFDGKTLSPYSDNAVTYLDESGQQRYCAAYTALTGSETSLAAGWYVADGNVSFGSTVSTAGDVYLILKDNAVMSVRSENSPSSDGISVGQSLSIYAQSTGESKGQLNVYASFGIYAVNNGSVIINGGQLTADCGAGGINASYVAINGGEVTATGNTSGINGNVTVINGGEVTAISPSNEGISGISVTINGGQVTVSGNVGIHTVGGNVNINGGQVTASGEGNGILVNQAEVNISGGQVTANGDEYGIATYDGNIYLGSKKATDFIQASSYDTDGTLTLTMTFIDEDGSIYEMGVIEKVDGAYPIDGKKLKPTGIPYLDENGEQQLCVEYTVLDGTETELGVEGEETWYVVGSDLQYTDMIFFNGNVHLILTDGKTMNVSMCQEGSYRGCSLIGFSPLTIYGQTQGTGTLSTTGMVGSANFTMNGGTVNVVTDNYGIVSMGDVVINDGTLYVEGAWGIVASPMGASASEEFACNVTINGGRVIAIGTFSNESQPAIGIGAMGDVTLGWTHANDYVYANGYYAEGTLSIAEGKTFVDEDGTTYNSGTYGMDEETRTYPINGKMLRPANAVMKGDANGDGKVDIADVTAIINKINNAAPPTFNAEAADVNGDGSINIGDVTGVINTINNKQ